MLKLLFLCCVTLTSAHANTTLPNETHAFSVATDTLTWPMSGYSGVVMFEHKRLPAFRFNIEAFGLTYPDAVIDLEDANANKGWTRKVQAVAIYVDHHPTKAPAFHYGLGINGMQSEITRAGYSAQTDLLTVELLIRGGYQWFPLPDKGVFLNPYLALGLPRALAEGAPIGDEQFKESRTQWIATVQLGWRFDGAP